MKALGMMGLGIALVVGACFGQGLPEPEQLRGAQDDISYAELLNAAEFTAQQLDALQGMQARLQADGLVGPGLATLLTKMLAAVLSGMSLQEAQGALGEQQQVLQQAQQQWQQSLQQSTNELQNLLTEEQQDALVWFGSPAHALDGVVEMVSQARAAEDAQWGQFKAQAGQGLSQMLAQVDPGGGTTPEKIGEILDQVRAMNDVTFEAKRGTLAQAWLPTLMPNVAQMLQNPQFRQQQLTQVCQRLVAYERGLTIVQAKRDALGAQ